MKPCRQTKDFSVFLEGLTLPSGVLYGNVSGQTYYYRPDERSLTIYDRYKKKWRFAKPDKHQKIMHYVHAFMRSAEYDASIRVRFCQFKQEQRDKDFRAAVRVMAKREKDAERFTRELLPFERKANYNFTPFAGSCYSQRAIDGKMYLPNDAYENSAVMDDNGQYIPVGKQDANPFPVFDMLHDDERNMTDACIANRRSNFNKPFEKGQNTCGPLQYMSARDGMKINPTKRTAEKPTEKNAYLAHIPGGHKFDAPFVTERYASISAKLRAEKYADPAIERAEVRAIESDVLKRREEALRLMKK